MFNKYTKSTEELKNISERELFRLQNDEFATVWSVILQQEQEGHEQEEQQEGHIG